MKRLLVIGDSQNAVSWYRGIGPLSDLRRQCPNLELVFAKEPIEWDVVSLVDGVFMLRPYQTRYLLLVDLCTAMKKPIWVDYDDNLYQVTTDNHTYHTFSDQEVQNTMSTIIANAKVVTTSSDLNKNQMFSLNKDIRVIPNAWDFNMFPEKCKPHKDSINIIWRGSNTHIKDVLLYAYQIVEVSSKFRDKIHWYFVGDPCWPITDHLDKKNYTFIPAMNIIRYFHTLKTLGPSIGIVPLFPSLFNECKSNIAWMEFTFAGAATLAIDYSQWNRPGITHYEDQNSLKEKLSMMIQQKDSNDICNLLSWTDMKENFALNKINKLRIDVLAELFDCFPECLMKG